MSTAGHTAIAAWAGGLGCPDTLGDDSISALITLPFTFKYGVTSYTQVLGPPRTYPNPLPSGNLNNTMRA